MRRDIRLRLFNRAEVVFVQPPKSVNFAEPNVLVRLSVTRNAKIFVIEQRYNRAYSAKDIPYAKSKKS
jgi:hypothetical protein